jgi:hypothetical protein
MGMTMVVSISANSCGARSPVRRASRMRTWPVWTCVAALLGTYACVAFAVAGRKGLSFDEGEEMAVGYDQWQRHDFRMENANGDFIKRWATLPFLWSRPKLPSTDQWFWRQGGAYEMGYAFCFNEGNDVDRLLRQARIMTIVLGVATGLLVFAIARSLFGNAGGLMSLALYSFSPHMLAFGAIVSTEMSICLALLGTTWFAWRLLHRVTPGRLWASLAFTAMLVLAKLTALAVLPIAAGLLLVKLAGSRPLVWALGEPRIIVSKGRQCIVFAALCLAHVAVGWGAIWTHYEFRFTASPHPDDPTITIARLQHPDPMSPAAAAFIRWSRRTHFLPEGFLDGTERLLQHNDSRVTFLDGQWKIGGWARYFPRTLWLKGSPAFLLLLAVAVFTWWRARRAHRRVSGEPSSSVQPLPSFYEATPLIAMMVVLLATAVVQNLDIGHRHVLPIYPPLFVLAGAAMLGLRLASKASLIALASLAAFAIDSAATFPNYLAYFNPLVGGPTQGYRHLVDSSVDWGMDLPELARWLARFNPGNREPLFLAYFGTDSPAHRHIVCRQLPSFFDWRLPEPMYPLRPGLYAISATLVQSVYTDPLGPWCTVAEQRYRAIRREFAAYEQARRVARDRAAFLRQYPDNVWAKEYAAFEKLRFGRLCAWLRHHGAPIATIGNSILVWRLDEAELRAALFGPPAEMDDAFLRELMQRR